MAEGDATQQDFDPDALRAKYRRERDRRLRPEGDSQYVEVRDELARFAEVDPHADPDYTRDSFRDEIDIAIVGGGFAGLITAARLRDAGFESIRIIEAAGDFGGTWYWNRYPGCQCDIESYTYIPLLEETGYMPSLRYAYAPEIYEQCKRIGQRFGLYDIAMFQTRVRELRWEEDAGRWLVTTDRDDEIRARFVITATGPLSKPKLPGIPGLQSYTGHMFHTSRWDFDYTGGDNTGGLTKLAGKKVAIIGTASTAVQCIPHLAAGAEHLYVFQRTPVAVYPRGNKATDPEWVASLEPGWQDARQRNFNAVVTGQEVEVDLVNDAWTRIIRGLQTSTQIGKAAIEGNAAVQAEMADFVWMNQVRAAIADAVDSEDLAEKLKPWYRAFCKRPTFHDEYLKTFNRPNVTLVDVSDCHGVERMTEKGVVANGVEYEVDCVIFATGFEISSAFERRVDFKIHGRNGQSLFDYWKDGRRTLHGHSSHGFPNLFNVGPSQNGLSMNFSSMYGGQSLHIAYLIKETLARGARWVEPTAEAEDAWIDTIRTLSRRNEDFMAECTPGYYNNEGAFKERSAGFLSDAYAPGIIAFNDLMADWREKGDMAGLQFG